jgi:hypothetical protein
MPRTLIAREAVRFIPDGHVLICRRASDLLFGVDPSYRLPSP